MTTVACRVLFVPVEGPARVVDVDDTHTALQELVGGYFETFTSMPIEGERALFFFCNEDGRDKGLPVNSSKILASVYTGEILGPVVVTAGDLSDGESYSLDDGELELLAAIEGGTAK